MPVSVVIPVLDCERTIGACLESLEAQRPMPAEVVVVDDASSDGTLSAVEEFRRRSTLPVRVLHNGRRNISRGRNLGIDVVQSRYVAFIDADATAEPGWTAALLDAFAADSTVAVVGGEVIAAHATPFAEAVAVNDSTVRRLVTRGPLLMSSCNMAVDLAQLGGERFDERWTYAEDVELVHRIGAKARCVMAADARVRHESRPTPRGYYLQMYRYGQWKVRYTVRTGQVRAVDYVPTAALLGSVALSLLRPASLLAFPALALAETAFVAAYRGVAPRLVPRMLAGWLVKNTGWGLGVLVGVAQEATGRSGVPAARPDPASVDASGPASPPRTADEVDTASSASRPAFRR